jgi:hypothetical protein
MKARWGHLTWHQGTPQAVGALTAATAVAWVTAVAAQNEIQLSGRLGILGAIVFAIGVVAGSSRLVAMATAPVLGAALSVSAAADDPAWTRSILIGCLWYVAVELAWDAIERRSDIDRIGSPGRVRIHEVATVLSLSIAVTTVASLLANNAPERTLALQGALIVSMLAALGLAINRSVDQHRQ